jgi:hypothetical protein
LPVKISCHQGWATVEITSAKTQEATWEVEFGPGELYHYPPGVPDDLVVQAVGLNGANVNWREQYYLNAGYQVYLNGQLLGHTPEAKFSLQGLNPKVTNTVTVTAVWEDGCESKSSGELKFCLARLMPDEFSLNEAEPISDTGKWDGYEIESMMDTAPMVVAGANYTVGVKSFVNSEVEYDVQNLYGRFSASVGVDEASSDNAGVEFILLADGQELWRSGTMKKTDCPKSVDVNIAGVRKLILKNTGSGHHTQADWITPKLKISG